MISFADIASAIRHRLMLVIVVAGAIFLGMVAIAMILPRQYTASSSVLVDLAQQNDTSSTPNAANNVSVIDSIIGTQIDIMRSNAVLGEVARRQGADAASRDAAVLKLRRELAIATDKGSNVIRMSYTGSDAVAAARTMNMIVDIFLAKQVDLRTMPARDNAHWYDSRTREVRNRFEAAQKRLSDFERQHGIVGVDRMDLEGDKARSLSTELVQAQGDAAAARSRAGSSSVPEVAQSDIVQNLQREVGLQAGKVAELSKTLGPNHPDMKAAVAQLAALRGSLGNARSTLAGSLSAASVAANRREAELRSELAQQQSHMLSFAGVQDQLAVLKRDVDAARQTYDTVRQRFNDASLQSEISQANASRLDRATPPVLPSKPNLIMWLAAAIILGAGGGIAAATLQELVRPRIRTPGGAARALDLDIIADMTSPVPATGSWRGHSKQEALA